MNEKLCCSAENWLKCVVTMGWCPQWIAAATVTPNKRNVTYTHSHMYFVFCKLKAPQCANSISYTNWTRKSLLLINCRILFSFIYTHIWMYFHFHKCVNGARVICSYVCRFAKLGARIVCSLNVLTFSI